MKTSASEKDTIFDYSKNNEVVVVEILNASRKLPKRNSKQ